MDSPSVHQVNSEQQYTSECIREILHHAAVHLRGAELEDTMTVSRSTCLRCGMPCASAAKLKVT